MLMYISTAESDKELTAVAFVLLSLHGCSRHSVPECVIMFISYNMCACLCVCTAYPYFTFRCVFALGSESVRMCFQVQWVSLGRLNTRQMIQVLHSSSINYQLITVMQPI